MSPQLATLAGIDFREGGLRCVATGRTFDSESNVGEVYGLPYVRYSPADVAICKRFPEMGKIYIVEFKGLGRVFRTGELEGSLQDALEAIKGPSRALRTLGFDVADANIYALWHDQRADGLYYDLQESPLGAVVSLVVWPGISDVSIARAQRVIRQDHDIHSFRLIRLHALLHYDKLKEWEAGA